MKFRKKTDPKKKILASHFVVDIASKQAQYRNMSRTEKAGLVTVTVRLPPLLCDAVVNYKIKHGVTVQKLITEAIAEKIGVNPQTGKPARKGDAK